MFDYTTVHTEDEFEQASKLFLEYAQWLGVDLGFQGFENELKILSSMYGNPEGTLILCKHNNEPIACVAVRKIGNGIAELKRMYVKPEFRKKGIGEELLNRALDFSKEAGYRNIRLDTLEHMIPAMNLYEKNGFQKIEAYYHNPISNAVYFEKEI